ncbi:MAG: aminotransferase class I/II-fold pyridoxal phosphate-dependent enzyme [Nitrospira sp.]|nr:aminotransferase class I/II-fold pyridoxal phosphate-dependent enzyme [Nitrospira sp.]
MEILSEMEQNIYRLAGELKLQERKIVDFSVSTNPLGVSNKIKAGIRKHLKYLDHYPDPDTKKLRKRLAQYLGIDPEMILCGNGSTELLYLMMRVLKPKSILVPAPTYSGYERACNISCKSQVTSYKLKIEDNFDINPDEFISALSTQHSALSMAFLCNPNNPTGRLLEKGDALKIAGAAKEMKCYLVVDEAFIDFCNPPYPPLGTVPDLLPSQRRGVESGLSPILSVISEVRNNPYLIVLRSFSNFYALAGLRLGYGVFPLQLIERLKEYKEPWTVNSLAQRAAVLALKDKAYRNETFRFLSKEKLFLEKGFRKIGIQFLDSDVNFYLLKINNANEIYQGLKEKGILIEDCSDFRGLDRTYIRISVKSHRENTILIRELAKIL